MEKIEIFKGKINWIYEKINIIFEFILSILFGYGMLKTIYIANYCGFISKPYLAVTILLGISIIAIMLINLFKYKDKLEKIFVSFIIPIGIVFLLLVIPNHVPDEIAHIYRAYDISKGNFITKVDEKTNKNTEVPEQLKEDNFNSNSTYLMLMESLNTETDYDKEIKVFDGAQSYSPTLYIPAAIMFFIGRTFNINIMLTIYLARLLNFIIFLIGGYYAIKKMPFGKLLMLTYIFSPMCLQQAISISADSLINTIAILFVSYSMHLIFKEEKMQIKEKIIYIALALLLAVAKFVYLPMLFITLLLLTNKKQNKKDKLQIILISIIVGIIIAMLWYLVTIQYKDIRTYIEQNNVNTIDQIKHIIKNPITYINTIFTTFHDQGEFYIQTFLGQYLCQFTVTVPNLTILTYLILLILSPLVEKHEKCVSRSGKILLILITFATIVLVMTALYLTWTTVGVNVIEGVQGRYFIPCIIVFLLCLCMKDNYIKLKYVTKIYPIFLVLINCSAIQFVIQRYI